MSVSNTVLALLDDLMFTVKINDAAKRAGLTVKFLKSEKDVLDLAKQRPALVIFDLNYAGLDSLSLIKKLKSDPETQDLQLLGYVSHVQADVKLAAQKAECDVVLPRSAFSQSLPQILGRCAGLAAR